MREFANALFQGVEAALRVPGYIPILSTITGAVRAVTHMVLQNTVALFYIIVGFTLGVLSQLVGDKVGSAKWLGWARFGVLHSLHASLNVWRGLIEMIPVVGNIAVYYYDKALKGKGLIPYPKA